MSTDENQPKDEDSDDNVTVPPMGPRSFEAIRYWLENWSGSAMSWDRNGVMGGTIQKADVAELLARADRTDEAEQEVIDEKQTKGELMRILGSLNRRAQELEAQREELLDRLEKAARFDAFETAIDMLRRTAHEPGAARNYVQCELIWERALAPSLPFKRACIAFVRDGAKNPAELVRDALKAKEEVVKIALELLDEVEDIRDTARTETRRRLGELLLTPEANHPPLPGTNG